VAVKHPCAVDVGRYGGVRLERAGTPDPGEGEAKLAGVSGQAQPVGAEGGAEAVAGVVRLGPGGGRARAPGRLLAQGLGQRRQQPRWPVGGVTWPGGRLRAGGGAAEEQERGGEGEQQAGEGGGFSSGVSS